jgi:hypothetical protein
MEEEKYSSADREEALSALLCKVDFLEKQSARYKEALETISIDGTEPLSQIIAKCALKEQEGSTLFCTICLGPFDIESEGGIAGEIGILPIAFCPTCKAGVADFGAQMGEYAGYEERLEEMIYVLERENERLRGSVLDNEPPPEYKLSS